MGNFYQGPINQNNILRGIGAVCINGCPIGAVKADSVVNLHALGANDLELKAAQYPGAILGILRGYRVYEVHIEAAEITSALLTQVLDLIPAYSAQYGQPLTPNPVASKYLLQLYGPAPRPYGTRCWTFPNIVFPNPDQFAMLTSKDEQVLPITGLATIADASGTIFDAGYFRDF